MARLNKKIAELKTLQYLQAYADYDFKKFEKLLASDVEITISKTDITKRPFRHEVFTKETFKEYISNKKTALEDVHKCDFHLTATRNELSGVANSIKQNLGMVKNDIKKVRLEPGFNFGANLAMTEARIQRNSAYITNDPGTEMQIIDPTYNTVELTFNEEAKIKTIAHKIIAFGPRLKQDFDN